MQPTGSERATPLHRDRTRDALRTRDGSLGLLLRLLDALAVGERVLHSAELREGRTAIRLDAPAEGGIARAASSEIGVAAGGADRVNDATERARLLELLLCGQRLYTGVIKVPSRTRKRFSALPSLTWPSCVRTIASSKPASCASVFARAAFTYAPVILLRAGIALSSVRRQLETLHAIPRSMSI